MTKDIEILDGEEWQSSKSIDDHFFLLKSLKHLLLECERIGHEGAFLFNSLNKLDQSYPSFSKNELELLFEFVFKLKNSSFELLVKEAHQNLVMYSNLHMENNSKFRTSTGDSHKLADDFMGHLVFVLNEMYRFKFDREKNNNAPARFGENHLRHFFNINLDKINLSSNSPKLQIEKKVTGDYIDSETKHGCIDYFFINDELGAHDFTNIIATFEIKGPARRSLLNGSKKNWYPKIIKDIEKQFWRSLNHPNTVNFIVLLFKVPEDLPFSKLKDTLYKSLEVDTKNSAVQLEEYSSRTINLNGELVHISIVRVLYN